MRVKRLPTGISLKKVKDGGVVGVARDAVVQDARLRCRENGRLAVDGFEGVGVLGEGVDLRVLEMNTSSGGAVGGVCICTLP